MVLFFDIDGTIIDDDTQIIPTSTTRAIARLAELGHTTIVNTGRPYAHLDPRIRAMPFGGFICGCGMEIRLGDTWLYRNQPTLEECRFVIDTVRQTRMQVLYEASIGEIYLDGPLSVHPSITAEAQRMAKKGFAVRSIDEAPEGQFMKLITFDGPDSRREEFIRLMEPCFVCNDRGNTMLEIFSKGFSKAEGMQALLTHLGVDREQTMAFGDSTNDLPMFRLARHTVCLGGGDPRLKAASEFVTAPVLEDGVEKALKHFGLLE